MMPSGKSQSRLRKLCRENPSGSKTLRVAAEVAVDVVANVTTEDLTEEDRAHKKRYTIAIAAE